MAKRFVSYLNNYEVEMKEKGKATFKSYIDCLPDESERKEEDSQSGSSSPLSSAEDKEEVEKSASEFFDNFLQPSLLPGERVIAQAESALRFAPYSDHGQGASGNLFVTNFKVAFVTADKSTYTQKEKEEAKSRHRNKLIDDSDIPLTCIDTIYQVLSGGKRRTLTLGQTTSSTSKYLEIHCKDFRIHVFGFKFSAKDQTKKVTNAILHHCCPTRGDLLFAYEFGLNGKFRENRQRSQFYTQQDWERELERLHFKSSSWRVTDVNKTFNMSTSLPEYFVVPASLKDADLVKASGQYNENRLPTWSYTYPANGSCLVRMSQIIPESDFKTCEEQMLLAVQEAVEKCDPVEVVDLGQLCPSLQDIRTSAQRLMTLCMTDSAKEFYSFDSTWLSRLDSSQWLQHVATCLKVAAEVAQQMAIKAESVALKEETDYDLSCVVSCLVQAMLDPWFRTQEGFAALVQREWVVMGHPFQRRNRLVQGNENQQCPMFLLFLDCVWQLVQQFPSRWGLTETFLTSLWDTVHLGLADTFLFDSAWQRHRFFREGRRLAVVGLPSAWEWSLQLGEPDTALFNNPLFALSHASAPLHNLIANAKGSLKREEEKKAKGSGSTGSGSRSAAGPLSSSPAHSYARSLTRYHGNSLGGHGGGLFRQPSSRLLLPVHSALPRLRLWAQCYLRWCVPARIVGGGPPAEYLQQCLLVEEVVCLDHKLRQLQQTRDQRRDQNGDKSEGAGASPSSLSPPALSQSPRPQSGLVFSLESQSALNAVHLTSSFPFPAEVTVWTQHKLISGPLSLYLHDSLVQYDNAEAED